MTKEGSVKEKGSVVSHPILATHVEEAPVNSFECIILSPLYALHIYMYISIKYIMPFCKCMTSYHMVFTLFCFCLILVLEILPCPYIQSCYTTCHHMCLSVWTSYCTLPCPIEGLSDCCPVSVVSCAALPILFSAQVCVFLPRRYQESQPCFSWNSVP